MDEMTRRYFCSIKDVCIIHRMSSLNKPQPLLYDFIREVKERVMKVYGHLPINTSNPFASIDDGSANPFVYNIESMIRCFWVALPETFNDDWGKPHPKGAVTYDLPIASGCLVNGELPCRVTWHPKKMKESASFKIIKNHLLPILREATRIAPTTSEKAKIVIDNLRYAMWKNRSEVSDGQQKSLENSFISTAEQVAILLRFVEKWTPVMSAQVDDFIDDDVIDNLKEKLNRLKQYTNDPDGEILY